MADADPIGNGNTAPGLTTTAVLLLIWSAFSYIVRVWVKTRFGKVETWGIDDTTISLSFLFALCHVLTTCIAVNHGYGNSWLDLVYSDRLVAQRALYSGQLLYVTSIGFTKISTSIFNARLTRDKQNVRLAYAWTGLCGAWTVASLFAVAIRGDLAQPWATLDGSNILYYRWMGVEVAGMAVEVGSWSISLYLIWGLHMPIGKRVSVTAIFACRLLIIPVLILRLLHLSPSRNHTPELPSMTAAIITEAAMQFAFILASVTSLKPFLRPFRSGYVFSVADGKGSGYHTAGTNSRGNAYYMLSTVKSTSDKKDGVAAQAQIRDDVEDHHPAQPLNKIPRAYVPGRPSHHATIRSRDRGCGSAGSEQMIISKTEEWTVTYEDDEPART